MKLLEMRNIIFGVFKFGNLKWMDAPYSVHLSKNLTHLEMPTDGTGLALHVCLFDTTTGVLCANRLIGLSTEISRQLIEMIMEQKQKDFNRKEYDANLKMIYGAYPTKQFVKMTPEGFRLR